jgi:hypothetical protein
MPDGPAIFAFRDALQTDLFLYLRRGANCTVLYLP